MKIRKLNIFAAAFLCLCISLVGCTKKDGAVPSTVSVEAIPTVSTNIDPTGSASISMAALASFSGKFTVSMYFSGATPPTKIDVVVRKNGLVSNVKVYKAAVSALPAGFTVTAADIATLFGAPIALNDTYDFAPDLYLGDKKYEAFPTVGLGTGAGLNGMPNFGEFTRFTAKP